jgi:hypothetical protein
MFSKYTIVDQYRSAYSHYPSPTYHLLTSESGGITMKSLVEKGIVVIVLCLIAGFVISPAFGGKTVNPVNPDPSGPGIPVPPGGLTPVQPLQPLEPVQPSQPSEASGRSDPGSSNSLGETASGSIAIINQVPLKPPSTSMLTNQGGIGTENIVLSGTTSGSGSSSIGSGLSLSGTDVSGLVVTKMDIGNNPIVPRVLDSHEYQQVSIPGLSGGEDIPIRQSAGDLLAQASGKENQAKNLEKTVTDLLGNGAPGKGTFTGNQYGGGSVGIDSNNPFQKSQMEDISRNLPGAHETQSNLDMPGSLGSQISSGNIGLSLQNSPADGTDGKTGKQASGAWSSGTTIGSAVGKVLGLSTIVSGFIQIGGIVIGDMVLGGAGDTHLPSHEELVKQVQEREAAQRAATAMPAYDPNNPTDQSIPNPNPNQEDESGAHSGSGWTASVNNQYSIANLMAFAQNAGQYQGNDNGEYGLASDTGKNTDTGLQRALINYHGGYGTVGVYDISQSGFGGDTGGYEYTGSHGSAGYNTYTKWADMSPIIRDAGQPVDLG